MSDVESSGAPKWKYLLALLLSVLVYACLAVPLLAVNNIVFYLTGAGAGPVFVWSYYLICALVFGIALCVVYRRFRSLDKEKAFSAITNITAVVTVVQAILITSTSANYQYLMAILIAFFIPLLAFRLFVIEK